MSSTLNRGTVASVALVNTDSGLGLHYQLGLALMPLVWSCQYGTSSPHSLNGILDDVHPFNPKSCYSWCADHVGLRALQVAFEEVPVPGENPSLPQLPPVQGEH